MYSQFQKLAFIGALCTKHQTKILKVLQVTFKLEEGGQKVKKQVSLRSLGQLVNIDCHQWGNIKYTDNCF